MFKLTILLNHLLFKFILFETNVNREFSILWFILQIPVSFSAAPERGQEPRIKSNLPHGGQTLHSWVINCHFT